MPKSNLQLSVVKPKQKLLLWQPITDDKTDKLNEPIKLELSACCRREAREKRARASWTIGFTSDSWEISAS